MSWQVGMAILFAAMAIAAFVWGSGQARARRLQREQFESLAAEHDSVLTQQRAQQQQLAEATLLASSRNDAIEQARARAANAEEQVRRAQQTLDDERRGWYDERDQLRARSIEETGEARRQQDRLEAAELRLADERSALVLQRADLEQRERELADEGRALEVLRRDLENQSSQLDVRTAALASLTPEQARAEVLSRAEHDARLEAAILARQIESVATAEAEDRARSIITTAIQRLASEQTSETVVSTVELPSDEMKGRIIGREGRNIRHFEQITGANVMIDDTPGSVLISCFDPVRREAARIALSDLVADGRIHPVSIEDAHAKALASVERRCRRAAEDALLEVGITQIDDALVHHLGFLHYRTSYGQNVLAHLVECAHLAGMMAAELGLDVAVCKRAAFLHDIGKALTHEVEGSHAILGADLARRHGEHPDIVHAIEAHHNEVEPRTVEALLTQAADAISGSRPGARRESLEAYIRRLERLEEIASDHDGVERVFAMQAGREIRVMVQPEIIDDAQSRLLARDIARDIQDELTYPGQIRVLVVRESRAVEIAH